MRFHSKTYIPFLSLAILTFGSCTKDWLDIKADKTLTIPSTLSDFQGLLDNVPPMTQTSPPLGEISSDGHYVTDAVFQNLKNSYVPDAYIWSYNMTRRGVNDWDQSYERILIDNIILEGLEKVSPQGNMEQEKWNDIRGQALYNRAKSFFDLTQAFTLPYDPTTASNQQGIVLRLNSDVSLPSTRATIKESYEQILKDLLEAEKLLPDRPYLLTRGSKHAVYALLSRVYLCMGDYENALKYANECLTIKSDLLDYNKISPSLNFIGRYNAEVIIHNNMSHSFITRNCLIDQSLYDSYDDNDYRKTILFNRSLTTGNITFSGNYDDVTNSLFCGLATDEVILTRAECYARLNKKDEAMTDLNTLMRKRWNETVPYIEFTASDPEDALRKILAERNKELILRGTRWLDLRRLNKDPRFAVTLSRTVKGETYTLEPNSFKYAFPIPDDVIELSGIGQNPGWKE